MAGASAARGFPRRCARRCSRPRARSWTRRNPIPAPGRSTVTTCSAASSSIISPTAYGAETPPAWMAQRAGSFASIVSRGAGVGELFGGKSLSQEWNDWIAAERDEALRLRDRLRAAPPGLAETTRVCDVAHLHVVSARLARRIAHRVPLDRRGPPAAGSLCRRSAVVRRRGGLRAWTARMRLRGRPMAARSCFRSSRWWTTPVCSPICIRIEIASGAITRLTRSARLTSPDVHPNRPDDRGRAVRRRSKPAGDSRCSTSGTIAPLTEFSTAIAWGPARWSPDGTRLAAVRFTRGASFDLVLLSADGPLLQSLTDDRALEGVPEWDASAPAGVRRLFFTSDRTRSSRALRPRARRRWQPRLYVTARVATGLHEVAVVPTVRRPASGTDGDRGHRHARGWPSSRTPRDRPRRLDSGARARRRIRSTARRSRLAARRGRSTGDHAVLARCATCFRRAGHRSSRRWRGWVCSQAARRVGVDVIGRHAWQGSAAYGPDGRADRIRDATSTTGSGVRSCLVRSPRPGGSSSASNPRPASCCASNASDPRPSASCFRGRRSGERRSSAQAFEIEDRHRENAGDRAAMSAADPIQQDPTLVGGGLGLSVRQHAGGAAVDFGSGRRPHVDVGRLPQGHGRRSLALGLGCGRIRLSIVSIMDDGWTAGAGGDRADRRTTRAGGQPPDRRRRRNDGGSRGGDPDFEVRGYPAGFVAASALWSARTEMRLPIARVSRGLGALPFYLRGLVWDRGSSTASGRRAGVDRLGSPQLLSTGAELSSDIALFSFVPIRIRTGVGVPLKSLGPVSRGEARFYVTAGTSF